MTDWTRIALHELTGSDPAVRSGALTRLAAVLRRDGACLLDVGPAMLSDCPDICRASKAFFAQPVEAKRPLAVRPGWPIGWYSMADDQGQPRERLLAAGVAGDDPLALDHTAFPQDLPELRTMSMALHAELDRVGMTLIEATAQAVGEPPAAHVGNFDRPGGSGLWLMHYPAVLNGTGLAPQGATAHTDLHPLVLIYQDAPGLEVWLDGRWLPAPVSSGSIVVLWGDAARLLWGPDCVPGLHRVNNQRDRDRTSICLFFHPRPTAPMTTRANGPLRADVPTWQACLDGWQASLGPSAYRQAPAAGQNAARPQ